MSLQSKPIRKTDACNPVGTGRSRQKKSESWTGRLVRFDSCLILHNRPNQKRRAVLVAQFLWGTSHACLIRSITGSFRFALRDSLLLSALSWFFNLGFGSLTLFFSFISSSASFFWWETSLSSSFYRFLHSFSFPLNLLLYFFLRAFYSFSCRIFRSILSFFFCSDCEREKRK